MQIMRMRTLHSRHGPQTTRSELLREIHVSPLRGYGRDRAGIFSDSGRRSQSRCHPEGWRYISPSLLSHACKGEGDERRMSIMGREERRGIPCPPRQTRNDGPFVSGRLEQPAGFLEREARIAREEFRRVAVADVAQEIRFDISPVGRVAARSGGQFAGREELGIHFGVVKPGHRPAIQS